jgi:hypothetical protein
MGPAEDMAADVADKQTLARACGFRAWDATQAGGCCSDTASAELAPVEEGHLLRWWAEEVVQPVRAQGMGRCSLD